MELMSCDCHVTSCSVYGVSRSATIVLAYLMWTEGRSLKVVQREVLAKKPDIRY